MRIVGTSRTPGSRPGTGHAKDSGTAGAPQSRALVPVTAPSRPRLSPSYPRPDAAFLAHLIATAQGAPQTRERRRAEPADAILAYAARRPDMQVPASFLGAL
jgi:hypothetical protein